MSNTVVPIRPKFRIHEMLRGRRTHVYLEQLLESQKLSAHEVNRAAFDKLKKLIRHCWQEVSFYRKLMEQNNIHPEKIQDFKDIKCLPVLEKNIIRKHLDRMVAKSYRKKVFKYNTGGSSGEPLVFYTDRHKEAMHNAHKFRARTWFGIYPGDRQVDFWGSPIELNKMNVLRKWKDRYWLNHVLLSAFDLTEQSLHNYVQFLLSFKPKLIYGYPSVIARVAQFVKDQQIELQGYRPQLIVCTSEMLYPHQRELLQQVFESRVANEYGSRDGGLIAHECPEGKMHIMAEHVYIEVVNQDQDGIGDILVTNLDAYGMPFIRYKIGDRGKLAENGSCSCGLPYPILEKIAGRSNDFLIGKNGKRIHSLAPIYVLRDNRKLKQFKLLQKDYDQLELQIVPAEPLSKVETQEIVQKMNRIFGRRMNVQFRFLDTIPPEKSGKYRYVVCEIPEAEN